MKKTSDVMEMPDNLQLQRGDRAFLPLRIVGTEDLIVHQWGQKSVLQLLAKATGQDLVKLPKDLTREYHESAYKNENGDYVLPCRIIKKVGVAGAISSGKAITKAELNRGLRIHGHTAVIQNAKPAMHTCMARTQTGTPDVPRIGTAGVNFGSDWQTGKALERRGPESQRIGRYRQEGRVGVAIGK